MKSILIIIFLAVLSSCRSAQIVDVNNVPIATNLEIKKVEAAILTAATKRGWIPKVVDSNTIEATLITRNNISVVVTIPFSESSFSILYKSSENLKYNPESRTIHKKYNSWIYNLRSDINKALLSSN